MPIRPLTADDRPLLRRATLANMNWSGPRFTLDDIDASAEITHYFRDFPGERDFGIADHDRGAIRSVAWLVFLSENDPGYGFVAADVPELSITTFDGFRGVGIGSAVLSQLMTDARTQGIRAISLSVEDGNGARRLYERAGFRAVGRRGGSDTMLVEFA